MVSLTNPAEKIKNELDVLEEKERRIRKIVDGGYISNRLGRYLEQLLIMDFSSKEAIFLHKNPEYGNPIKSFVQMRSCLDCISGLFLENSLEGGAITRRKSGLYIINKPNLGNVEKYRELYDLAKKRYDDAVENYKRLLGDAA